jgi:hypothetical protein
MIPERAESFEVGLRSEPDEHGVQPIISLTRFSRSVRCTSLLSVFLLEFEDVFSNCLLLLLRGLAVILGPAVLT